MRIVVCSAGRRNASKVFWIFINIHNHEKHRKKVLGKRPPDKRGTFSHTYSQPPQPGNYDQLEYEKQTFWYSTIQTNVTMKTGDIQREIFTATGLKTSVRKGVGSMRGYHVFTPMIQGGERPYFPFDYTRTMKAKYPGKYPGNFFSISSFDIQELEEDHVQYKKERKYNPPAENPTHETTQEYTSRETRRQIRADKTARIYAKKIKQGKNVPRYY